MSFFWSGADWEAFRARSPDENDRCRELLRSRILEILEAIRPLQKDGPVAAGDFGLSLNPYSLFRLFRIDRVERGPHGGRAFVLRDDVVHFALGCQGSKASRMTLDERGRPSGHFVTFEHRHGIRVHTILREKLVEVKDWPWHHFTPRYCDFGARHVMAQILKGDPA